MSENKHPDTYVIIPLYNEAGAVRKVADEVLQHFSNVVCVNDGSSDNSADEIIKTKARLVNHPINLGQGAALQTGIEYSLSDKEAKYFITFDSDGQHSIEDAEKMLDYIRSHNVDIVLGSRFLGKAVNISVMKKFVLKVAILFSNRTSGLKLTDAHNGLRVFNRYVAENLNIVNPDFSHASEIIETIAAKKFKYKELPVTITYSEYSKAKGQSMFNAINIGLDVLINRIIK
jgi:glycosyltransferase involved in cell wall biosynthesis